MLRHADGESRNVYHREWWRVHYIMASPICILSALRRLSKMLKF